MGDNGVLTLKFEVLNVRVSNSATNSGMHLAYSSDKVEPPQCGVIIS